jgi:anthranilate phosphoribosyltransferase
MLEELIQQLEASQHLTDAQTQDAADDLVNESVAPELKADFLCHLALKGETVAEITAFARVLREKAVVPPIDAETRKREILDVVGTGGDRLGTFNISTTVAIVCAAAGVTVAKHGNRAATSQCGSADVLEALGVPIDLTPEQSARALHDLGFAFFFAPKYHPTFKHVAQARKLCAERGQRTIFNFLGPLLNPARPSAALVGVPQTSLCEPLAKVLQSLGMRRAMVVCGKIGMKRGENHAQAAHPDAALPNPNSGLLDELSILGENTVAEFYHERGFMVSVLETEHFAIQQAKLEDLLGGDRQVNAEIVRRLLAGKERGPKRDAILLNAAAALFVAGKAKSLLEGWDLAAAVIDDGHASEKLKELRGV